MKIFIIFGALRQQTPEPDPTIFENKSPLELVTQVNDIDPQSI